MWRLNNLYEVAKSATEHASEYVNTVQTKAQSVVASVKDEAATLLHAIGTTRPGPVDEILYEEIEDYKVFSESFQLDPKTETITKILEEDEEIKDLHEQMVPEQIPYEEFWCRYFFREQQEIEHQKQEEERAALQKKKAEEEAALAAIRKAQQEEEDAALAAQLMEESSNAIDSEISEDSGASTSSPVGSTNDTTWKEKARELQAKLTSMEKNAQIEKVQIRQEMEEKYQSLCDSYENRMAEMTIQIDNARAAGYDDGIRESEQIVDSIRKSTEKEIETLQQQLASTQQQQKVEPSSIGVDPAILDQLQQEKDSLYKSLSESQAKVVEVLKKLEQESLLLKNAHEEKVKLEVELNVLKETFDKERSKQLEELAASKKLVFELEAQLKSNTGGASDSTSPATEELSQQLEQMKGEAEIWRVRALKMKKAKEMVDEELAKVNAVQEKQASELLALQASQSSASPASNDDQVVELQSNIAALKAQLYELTSQKQTSEVNLKSQLSALEQKLEQATLQVEASYKKGIEEAHASVEVEKQKAFEAGAAKSRDQIQDLQSELEHLRQNTRTLEEKVKQSYNEGLNAERVVASKERETLEASHAAVLNASKDIISRLQAEVAELRESKQHADTAIPPAPVVCTSPAPAPPTPTPSIASVEQNVTTMQAVIDEAVATTASASVDETWGQEELAIDDEPVIRDDWGEW